MPPKPALPGIVGFSPIVIIDLQLLIDAVAVFDDESAVFLSIVEDLDSAVDRSYFLTQEMPAKMRLTGGCQQEH